MTSIRRAPGGCRLRACSPPQKPRPGKKARPWRPRSRPLSRERCARNMRNAALLVIDMQRDFLQPDGYAAKAGLDITPLRGAIAPVAAVLAAARAAGLAIVHTREGHLAD